MRTAGVIVAAGLSSRMGDFKPLLPYKESTIIENVIDSMKKAGVETIVVVIGHQRELMEQVLKPSDVVTIFNPIYATSDMLTSIKKGLERLEDFFEAVFIVPGDMPAISPDTYIKLIKEMEKSDSKIIYPTIQGRKKHPPLIRAELLVKIYDYTGDSGLRDALAPFEENTAYVEVEDYGCTIDTDTPEDYKKLLIYENSKD